MRRLTKGGIKKSFAPNTRHSPKINYALNYDTYKLVSPFYFLANIGDLSPAEVVSGEKKKNTDLVLSAIKAGPEPGE